MRHTILRLPIHVVVVLLIFATSICVSGKVGDPPPLIENGVKFQSHENYIEAIDSATGAQIWCTVLYDSFEPWVTLPIIEQDAQWNIIVAYEVKGDLIHVRDGDGNQYRVQKKTGVQIFDEKQKSHSLFVWILIISLSATALLIFIVKKKKK